MSDFSMSRSNYLKLMHGKLNKEINSLTKNTITSVGDTSYDTAEIFAVQQNNSNAIEDAKRYLESKKEKSDNDRNWWERTWDTIGETINDVAEGFLNFGDDIFDFTVYGLGELGEGLFDIDDDWAHDVAGYDWQAQVLKLNPAHLLNGDIFTDDYWNSWDSEGAREEINKMASNSYWNLLGEKGHNFVKQLGQGIGYMIPTIATGSMGTMAVGAFAGGTADAYEESGDFGKSMLYGLGNAGVEVATEYFVGKGLKLLGLGTGKVAGVFGKTAGKETADTFGKTLLKTMFEEGVEEGVSGVLQPVIQSIYKGEDAFKDENGNFIYFNKEFWLGDEGVANQALLGSTMGGILGGVSLRNQYNALGKEGVATVELLEETRDLSKKLGNYEKGSEKYNKTREKMLDNASKISAYLAIMKTNGNKTHIRNIAKVLSSPSTFKRELEKSTDEEITKLIDSRIEEIKSPEKFATRNLFNELQANFGTDYTLEFGKLNNSDNAFIDQKNKKIVINENISEEYAGVLAHEYLGHGLVDSRIDTKTRQKMFDSVIKTDWYKKYNAKLRKAYQSDKNYQSLNAEQKTAYWQSEVINNYLEDLFKKGNTLKSVKMINDVFLRNTLLNRMQAFLAGNKNFKLLKNNKFLNEFAKSVKTILDSTNKNVSRALDKYLKGETLNKSEENYYKKYKAIFDNARLAYSKNFENVEGIDASNKPNFIKKLDEIYGNPKGKFVEFENINFTGLKNIIKNHLQLNLDLPLIMKIKKLRKVMSVGNDIKNQHELSADNIYMALTNLNDTPLITQSKTKPNNFTIFSNIKNKNGETIVVGFTFEYNFKNKKERFVVNKIDTIFGMDENNEQGYYTYFENANYKVVYKKGKGWLAPIAPTSSSFNNSISGNEENINRKYSKSLDSEENPLTEAQERYFKDSKFVDEEGNLLILYHGSDNAGFMKFNNENGIYFLTPEYDVARSYTETYNLVVTKSFKTADELIEWWYDEGAQELGKENVDILPKSEALDDINNALSIIEKQSGKDSEMYKIYKKRYDEADYIVLDEEYSLPPAYSEEQLVKEYIPSIQEYKNLEENYEAEERNYDEDYERNTNNIYKVYVNAKNPAIINCRGANFTNILFKGQRLSTDEIAKIVKEEGKYDGIIFRNVVDNGKTDMFNELGMGDVYVAFEANQIKAVDNFKPTSNDDIRYSKKLDVAKTEKSSYNEIKQEEVSDEFRKLQEECRKLSEEVSFSERSKSLDDSLYGRIERVLSRQIGIYNSRNSNSTRLLKDTNNFEIYENIDGDLFHDCFEIARTYLLHGELVDLHDNYNDSTCYLSKDGLSGFAITKNGDLISVFNLSKQKGFLRAISPVIKEKAKTLDCYVSSKQNLQGMYEAKFGFKTASIMEHNMEYDHDDIAKNHNNPKVAFMVNTDKTVETKNFDKDSYDEAQAYQQSFVQDYQVATLSTKVATLSTKVDNTTTNVEDLTPYETNKAKEIKESVQEKEGKAISLKNTQDVYNAIEGKIKEMFGDSFKIKDKKSKARRLFEEYNLSKNTVKKSNCRKFVEDILEQEVLDNISYREYLISNGVNIKESVNQATEIMFELLNAKAVDSNTTKKINKLFKWLDAYAQARAEQIETFKFMKKLNSIRSNLAKNVAKYGNTGQLDITSGIKGLFYSYFSKFRFTKANYLSLTNLANLQKMVNDGSFKSLINSILNPYNEVDNIEVLKSQAETIIEMAEELANSQTTGQRHLTYDQVIAFNNLNKAVYKLYKDYTSGVLETTRNQAEGLISRAKKVRERAKTGKLKNKLKKAKLDALSPKDIIAEMVGGTHTEEFDLIYNELYKKPYEKQINKYVDFLKERDKCIKEIQKQMNKKVKVGDTTVKKYVLFQFYLNTLSPDNLTRMKNSNLTFTEEGTSKKLRFEDLENAMNQYLTEAEKTDLDNLFKLYNGSVKNYVENMSEKILGFKVSRNDYYPIVASEVVKNQDLSNPNKTRYNINALNNGRLKKLSNSRTVIEINVNPIYLFDSYIESMTITGEIGLESQKLNRLFQIKDKNGDSFASVVNEYIPEAKKTYIPSIFNKLIGNTKTIERSSMLDKTVGRFATATLGLNVRSMLKQIGSFFTAWTKVGIGTGFKTMLNPLTIKRVFKNRAYLKANNPVFKLRTYENGYVRGTTLSAGAGQYAGKVMKTLTNASLKGLEAMDRFTCYLTFTLCEEYVKKTYGYEIGTQENLALANEMFSEMILETQSNSDRIAMSRVRSGEKGAIVKNLFGLFQSDAQNKAGLGFTTMNDIRNIKNDIIDVEAKIKNTTDPESLKALEKEKARLNKELNNAHARMRAYASGLVLSGLAVALADKLADWIYDKEDPEETELSEILMETLGNTTLDWIPYLNQMINWWEYDGVEFSSFEKINELIETIKGLTDGNNTSQEYLQALIKLGTVMGLPLENLNKLVQGTISNFDPEAGLKYRSLFYNMSQSYLGRETNAYLEKGNIEKAKASISFNYSMYKFEASDELIDEIITFKQNGINISIKNTPTSLTNENGETYSLSSEEMKEFRNVYSEVNNEFAKMKSDSIYQSLSMEEKAKVVKKLIDLYFDKAKGGSQSKLSQLVSRNIPVYNYLLLMVQLESKLATAKNRKQTLLKEINKIKTLSRKEKLLLVNLMGYSISDTSKPTLNKYLKQLGLSKEEIEKWVEK